MSDLTVIYITANMVPAKWVKYQMEVLKEAIGDAKLLIVSRDAEAMPETTILDTMPKSYSNIYYMLLQGAKLATTPYIAMAEDDVLYTRKHFYTFRPQADEFAYNRNRWSLFTFGEPTYSLRDRISNCSLIAPTKLAIEALTERFTKHPNGSKITGELGKERTEKHLGVTIRKRVDFYSLDPIVQFNHDYGTDEVMLSHRKRMGWIRAYDIPTWGRSEELVKKFI